MRNFRCPKCKCDVEICHTCNGYGEYYSEGILVKLCIHCKGNGLIKK